MWCNFCNIFLRGLPKGRLIQTAVCVIYEAIICCSQESDFSGHRSTVCSSPPLFLLSYWSHWISMPASFFPRWLGEQTSPMCLVMPQQHLINHLKKLFGDHLRGREGRRSGEALVEWGCLVCMRDGRQCIKRWQLSHSFLNKSSETLAGCALTLIIHLNKYCRGPPHQAGCHGRREYENWRCAPGFLICKRVNIYLTQIAKAQKHLSSSPPDPPPLLSLSHRFMYRKSLKFKVRLSKKRFGGGAG